MPQTSTEFLRHIIAVGVGSVPKVTGSMEVAAAPHERLRHGHARGGLRAFFCIKSELRAAKWRHWKLHFVFESEPNQGVRHLETPWLFNIKRDPKEETDAVIEDGWARGPMRHMVLAFEQSLREHPPIAPVQRTTATRPPRPRREGGLG